MLRTQRLPSPPVQPAPQRRPILKWLALGLGALLIFDLITFLLAEGLWFEEVNYPQVFGVRLRTQSGLGLLVFGCSIGFLLSNLALARQHAWPPPSNEELANADQRPPLPTTMGLGWLLPLTLVLSLMVGVMLVYHGQIAVSHWHPNLSLYRLSDPVPLKFRPEAIWQIGQELGQQVWQLVLVLVLAIALLISPQLLLNGIAILMSLGFALVLSEHWLDVLPYFHPTPFGQTDPLFGQDISFYIFQLPVWELLTFWLIGLLALSLISVSLVYLLSGNSLSQGRFLGLTAPQQRHLYGLGAGLMLAVALSYWLDRFELLYSPTGVAYGASYSNVVAELPAYTSLSLLALGIAAFMGWHTLAWPRMKPRWQPPVKASLPRTSIGRPGRTPSSLAVTTIPHPHPWPLLIVLGTYLLLAAIAIWLLPLAVQRLLVQPNELAFERPYIERTIALTRNAFKLDDIDVEPFNPQNALTYEDLRNNALTVRNIRIWDTRPLLETNRQLQRIRLYYEFPDADIDRYTLKTEDGGSERQQVLIAARELDYNSVPAEAQTWVNQHLIYTHGYGFTLSPVNIVGDGGLPDYFIRGIEHIASSDRIRDSIPVGKPRIYYGELTDTYVMTNTQVQELDFPSGSDNEYNTYDGNGGVSIGSFWQRLVFAKHLRDWRMLLTEDFTPQTKLLFRRNIRSRVRAIAPFLRYDSDPYLVVANASDEPTENYLYWVIDAYTTSDRYPYSDPLDNDFNYIRNSVKVVIDAYHGSVSFYIADAADPIIQTWNQIFPGMFQSLEQMPVALQSHIRYPQDFYQVQSEELMTYHMTDPQVFYNREDMWRAPTEIYGNEQQLVQPYFLIMKLPEENGEEFILLRPFTPVQRRNLIAWLAARSDGDRYGRMLLYSFPKQELVYGPEQIEARINQDPVISQQISLWNRQGSRAIQGNLLVIPIEESLLYVEPLYLEAEQNRLPTLVRVIVAYENRIAMAETLDQAIDAIFRPDESTAPAILRSVDDLLTPALE